MGRKKTLENEKYRDNPTICEYNALYYKLLNIRGAW
jgi:hypothetical protein